MRSDSISDDDNDDDDGGGGGGVNDNDGGKSDRVMFIFLAYCSTLKQNTQLIKSYFFADYGELSRNEEYIIHHSRPRGQKSVRVHRQGHENGETLLPRVQSRIYRKSNDHNSCLTLRDWSARRAWSVRVKRARSEQQTREANHSR